MFAFELGELELSINVDLKGSTLHELSLNHGPDKESHDAGLPFVFLDPGVGVLNGVWHVIEASQLSEYEISGEDQDENDRSKPSD